jgi:hypothetical protein
MIVSEHILSSNYVKEERIISVAKANILALLYTFPFITLFSFLYFRQFNLRDILLQLGSGEGIIYTLLLLFFIILLTVVHELVHGVTWQMHCENKWKSIKFGIMKEFLTPYCHCKEILYITQYIIGAIMPLIVTGIIPMIAAIILRNNYMFLISQLMILAAGGDIAIVILLLREDKETLAVDHPTKCGCIVYRKK